MDVNHQILLKIRIRIILYKLMFHICFITPFVFFLYQNCFPFDTRNFALKNLRELVFLCNPILNLSNSFKISNRRVC